MDTNVESLPLDGGQDDGARQVWMHSAGVSEPVQPPSHDTHEGDVVLQAVYGLQATIFDAATRLDHFVEDFDLPTLAIPLHDAAGSLEINDGGIGQQ